MTAKPEERRDDCEGRSAAYLPKEDWVDERGQEMADSARIWHAYVQEACQQDKGERARWSQSMDVLFIFAALFSAVLTAFVVNSCEQLSADPANTSLVALQEITVILRSIAANEAPPRSPNYETAFEPPLSAVWVNALWFSSLAISLSVSSMAVLVKQWINALHVDPSGSAKDFAHLRQFRHEGILAWKLPAIINMLPILLLLSLMLFLSGLVVFMWSINLPIAMLLLVLIGVTGFCHMATAILPLFYSDCPFRTPLTPLLYRATYTIYRIGVRVIPQWTISNAFSFSCPSWVLKASKTAGSAVFSGLTTITWCVILPFLVVIAALHLLLRLVRIVIGILWGSLQMFLEKKYGVRLVTPTYVIRFMESLRNIQLSNLKQLTPRVPRFIAWPKTKHSQRSWLNVSSHSAAEHAVVLQESQFLDGSALLWLVQRSREATNRDCAVEAVADLGMNMVAAVVLSEAGVLELLKEKFRLCFRGRTLVSPIKAELLARGLMNIHCCLRVMQDGVSAPSRARDIQLVRSLMSNEHCELAVTGACAGASIEDVVHMLEKHVRGQQPLSSFSVKLLVDTIRDEFSCRKGWNDDYWVTDQSWGKWGQLIVPLLIYLLDGGETIWEDPDNPDQFITSVLLALSVFTCGYRVSSFKSLAIETEQARHFTSLSLHALVPVIRMPGRYVATKDIAAVKRTFCGLTEKLVYTCSRDPKLMRELAAAMHETNLANVLLNLMMEDPSNPALQKAFESVVHLFDSNIDILGPETFSVIAWFFFNAQESPSLQCVRRALLYRLEDFARESGAALKILRSELSRALPLLLAPEDPNRRDAFRVLLFACTTVFGFRTTPYAVGESQRIDSDHKRILLDELNLLKIIEDYFLHPWGVREDEVSLCFHLLYDVLNHTSGEYDSRIAAAVQSIAWWPERQWQGEERLFPWRKELKSLQCRLGIQPPVIKPMYYQETRNSVSLMARP